MSIARTAAPSADPGVPVWDLPTRLFHWLLTLLIVLQYATGQFGMLDMVWHYYLGYATLALILFRILWGCFGSQTSRFAQFLRGPAAIVRYLKAQFSGNPQSSIGHNPIGGWSALTLMLGVLVQCVSGLFASDGVSEAGPWAERVPLRVVKLMTRIHDFNQSVLLLLIAAHVVAALLYLLLGRDNLILPMITGRKRLATAAALQFVSSWRALVLALLAMLVVAAVVWLA